MKSYRIFIVVVVVLILVNCIVLGAFWYQQKRPHSQEGPPQAVNSYLIKELSLTADQQKTYAGMVEAHFEFTRKLNRENRQLRDEFFENIKSPVLDTAAANATERKIANIQMMLDTATLSHFRQFRKILNVTQQDKFDHIIQNALHMMGGPPQGRPGMRHGPNGMPPSPDGQGPPPDGQGPPLDGQLLPPPPGN
jgi:Spy/CpxP family protein refolding chaperone